jgi:plastocyanin
LTNPARARRLAAAALAAGVIPVAVAACGGEPVDTAGSPATPAVTPDTCNLLSATTVRAALIAPVSPSASASPETPAPEPSPSGIYTVRSVSINGRLNVANAGVCTYTSPAGGQLVVAVLPKTTLTAVRNAETGANSLGSAVLASSDSASVLDVQAGAAVVELTLVLGDTDPATRANRLAQLAGQITSSSLPTLAPGASPTPGGASASAAPVATVGSVVTGQPGTENVSETDALKFDPGSVSAKTGDVVLWTNTGTVAHNVTFDDYPDLTSGTLNGGDKYEIKFTKAGTYSYHCTFHSGMDGQITVG